MKGIFQKLTKDLDAKEKNKNNNKQSDSSYIKYDHTAINPDDEGEGLEDINDNNIEADEQPLKHSNPISKTRPRRIRREILLVCYDKDK